MASDSFNGGKAETVAWHIEGRRRQDLQQMTGFSCSVFSPNQYFAQFGGNRSYNVSVPTMSLESYYANPLSYAYEVYVLYLGLKIDFNGIIGEIAQLHHRYIELKAVSSQKNCRKPVTSSPLLTIVLLLRFHENFPSKNFGDNFSKKF